MRPASFVHVLLFCTLTWCKAALATPGEEAPEKVFLGYVAGSASEINYSLYTHLAHAFLVAEKDGTLKLDEQVPSKRLTREAHAADVKVLISLGGWGWDENFAAMSLDSAAEDRYVQAVMEVVDKYDYDGIDLDWEYPDNNIEIVGFKRLARRFRKLLDGLGTRKEREMLLTMAASAHPITLEWLSNDFLLETMDWVNVMTYDYTGRWCEFAGHHAPLVTSSKLPQNSALSIELTMKYLLEQRGFPADRLTLGIPLYGRVFSLDTPYASTDGAPQAIPDALTYREIVELQGQAKWKRTWDDETKNPWLVARDGTEIVCYDDSQSINHKTEWAIKQGLRGVFVWQIAGDRMPDGSNPLQEIVKNRLAKNVR